MNGEDRERQILCDIAQSAFGVVNRLLARDQLLARGLRSSTTGSRQIYREECITVEVAAELRELFGDHVEITLFTPPEEKPTGADWYWRFEKAGRAIHARVQAKRVQRTEFDQADGDGRVDLNMPQLRQLVEATRNVPLTGLQAWIATYTRFKATPPCGFSDLQLCHRHRHADACANHEPSLWIAHAQELLDLAPVETIQRDGGGYGGGGGGGESSGGGAGYGGSGGQTGRQTVQSIVERSLRLDCILPCIDGRNVDPGPASKGFMIQRGLSPYQDCVSLIARDTLLRKEFEGALRIAV